MLSRRQSPHELCKLLRAAQISFLGSDTVVQKEGFSRVLEIDDAMPLLLMSLEYINMVSQSSVLMVLAAVCVVSRSAQRYVLHITKQCNETDSFCGVAELSTIFGPTNDMPLL
jgi:ABC-type siderophore export system fused ATPase/permease subunit